MESLFIECPTGLSGDMLLAAFFDLGLPKELLESKLKLFFAEKTCSLKVYETKSYGLRGLRFSVKGPDEFSPKSRWLDIKKYIYSTPLDDAIKENILNVYKELAEAEAFVHGCEMNEVHFHEIASYETFINILGVCIGIDFFKPKMIFCMPPPVGSGYVKTSHGLLPVPVPTVLEIAKRNQIKLLGGENFPSEELTTPTGIALMSLFANKFEQPSSYEVLKTGVGLGSKDFGCPNMLRICKIKNSEFEIKSSKSMPDLFWQNLLIQEAWIDDASPEDLAEFIDQLRLTGAIEVACNPVQMKKGRIGMNVKAIVHSDLAEKLRSIWFLKGTTIGLRESVIGRWLLPRRRGSCMTSYGEIACKQVKRPDGSFTLKPEHSDLLRVSAESRQSLDQLRKEIILVSDKFVPNEDWSFSS